MFTAVMPKEQPQSGKSTTHSNSKNAKEKSNCATLRSCQGGTHRGPSAVDYMSKHVLCWDSEKDSGYSGELGGSGTPFRFHSVKLECVFLFCIMCTSQTCTE